MRHGILFLLPLSLAATAPSIAAAQRTQAAKHTSDFDTPPVPSGPTLRVRDVEDQSPLKMFVDKHKDLKLTDAQVSQLKAADDSLHQKNQPSFQAIDSLVHVMRSAASSQSDVDRGRARLARANVVLAIDAVNENNAAAARTVMSTFNPEQQSKAAELVAKQLESGKKMVRERLGGGRGGSDGGRS